MIFDLLLDVCLKLLGEWYFIPIFQFRQKVSQLKMSKKLEDPIISKMVCMKIFNGSGFFKSKKYVFVITARFAKNTEVTYIAKVLENWR